MDTSIRITFEMHKQKKNQRRNARMMELGLNEARERAMYI